MTDTTATTVTTVEPQTDHVGAGHRGDTLLELDDIHVFYGNIEALKGVSLSVARGEIVTLIGSNGAGKSTTLRAISGTHRPRSGSIRLAGNAIHHLPAHEIVGKGIAHSPEGRKVFSRMSVFENLQMGAFSRHGERIDDDVARVFDLFPRLRERRSQKAGTMSGGEQQMLAMGRALMARPSILLLDGPLADPDGADLQDHRGDQRPGHHGPAGRAERAHGAQRRAPRLRHPDRQDHPGRYGRQPGGQRAGAPGLPRRDLIPP
jgi:branched-chain amino acid transport system ATP-binding protein